MPILHDILDHKVLGREFKRGYAVGVLEAEIEILRRLIEKRFGKIPSWANKSLIGKSEPELEALTLRLLDASDLKDLFK